jgi:hypothetical protein
MTRRSSTVRNRHGAPISVGLHTTTDVDSHGPPIQLKIEVILRPGPR